MKRQQTIIAIFALFIFAISANAQFGDFINKVKKVKEEVEKTKQEIKDLGNPSGGGKTAPSQPSKKQNNVETWITFSKTHTRSNENHTFSMNTFGCGDSIFTTVNFREPVDNSGGFTVSMLVDGELALKEQMSGGSATSVNETIHIELIPADDAVTGYPQVTVTAAKTILDKLPQGSHTIQIAVSLNDNPDNVAVGEFEFTGGAGCNIKDKRKQNNRKETKQEADNTQQQTQTESKKPAMVEIELQGACGESARLVTIDNGPNDRRTVYVKNGNSREQAVVGAQIFLKADFGIDTTLIYTVGSDSYQVVKVCQ